MPALMIAKPCCLTCAGSRWSTSTCEPSGSAWRQIAFALDAHPESAVWDGWDTAAVVEVGGLPTLDPAPADPPQAGAPRPAAIAISSTPAGLPLQYMTL